MRAVLIIAAALSCLIALLPASASAGINHWTTNGPYGGIIKALAVSPDYAADHAVFAGTGDDGVFKSTDGGTNWSAASNGLPAGTIVASMAISPDFAVDKTIFIGVSDSGTGSGIYRSSDGGGSWSAVYGGLPAYAATVHSLTISPNFGNDQTIFAAYDANGGGGIIKSTDDGSNWSQVSGQAVAALAISPNFGSDQTLFAGVFGNPNSSIIKSINGGSGWTTVNTALPSTNFNSLSISPNFGGDGTLFAGFGSGVYKSIDGGVNWGQENNGITNTDIWSMAVSVNYQNDNMVLAASYDGGVYKSIDGGANWSAAGSGFPGPAIQASMFAFSPVYQTDGTIFAGCAGGVFKTVDGAANWSAASGGITDESGYGMAASPAFATDGILFDDTTTGIFKSSDQGNNWSAVTASPVSDYVIAVSPQFGSDHTVFSGRFMNVIDKSNDGGGSWTASGFFYDTYIRALSISPNFASDQTLFAAVNDAGGGLGNNVYRSTDAGGTWHPAGSFLGSPSILSLAVSPDFASDGTVWAGTAPGGMYKSTDGGSTWNPVSNGPTNTSIYSVAISPDFASDQTLIADGGTDPSSGSLRVFLSTDGGASWNARSSGLPPVLTDHHITALAFSPEFASDRTIFAGTDGFGVYESTDGGSTWSALNTGLTNLNVNSLAVSPGFATDETVFASTGGGVFGFTFGADSTPPAVANVLPDAPVLTPSTIISADYSDSGSGVNTASVAVYLDGVALSGCTITATHASCPAAGLSPGSHTIGGQVADNAGNVSPISGSFTVSRNYYFTWYDNVGGQDWMMLANPSASGQTLAYGLSIGSSRMALPGSGQVTPGGTLEPDFPGETGGPVEASSLTGGAGIISQRILWPAGGSSLEEVPAQAEANLSDHYWWTWYDNSSPGMINWILVASPNDAAADAYYQIRIGGSDTGDGSLSPGELTEPNFPGTIGGPVQVIGCSRHVSADGSCPGTPMKLIASQRVLSSGGGSFNELPGVAGSDLKSDYFWTWYDQLYQGSHDWVMVANPAASAQVHYQIDIAGGCKAGDAARCSYGALGPGGHSEPTFPGVMDGPVEVRGCSQELGPDGTCPGTPEPLVASQRTVRGPSSFEEVPGYPASSLASSYDWTWYDQHSPGSLNWVLVANPSAVDSVYYRITVAGSAEPDSGPNPGLIPPSGRVTPTFPGLIGGPVEVKTCSVPFDQSGSCAASRPVVMASQRVTWNGYFNEVLGGPAG